MVLWAKLSDSQKGEVQSIPNYYAFWLFYN